MISTCSLQVGFTDSRQRSAARVRAAFTLIELLVVIAIIAIVARCCCRR